MNSYLDLSRALKPNDIALIGASDRALSRGSYIWQSLCQSPLSAHAWPVNPKYKYIGEHRCYANILDVPVTVDLAIIALRADRVLGALQDIAQAHIKAVLIATEEGDYAQNRHWLDQIQAFAKAHQITLIGPDSLGIMIPGLGLNASFRPFMPRAGNIALLAQSGLIATSLLDYAQEAELGFSGVVTTGAELDVNMASLIEYFAKDRNTRVIAIELQALRHPQRFYSAIREASLTKHVIVLKAGDGSSYVADRLASFKYATDAGDDRAFSALVEQAGAQRVRSFEHFKAGIAALATNRLPRGARLALISNDSGFAALCADAAHAMGVDLHGLSNETIHALEKLYPSPQLPINPIIVGATASSARFRDTLDAVLKDPMIDGAIVIVAPGPVSMIDPTLKYLAKCAQGATKPVITAWVSDTITRSVRSQLRLVPNAPISAIQSPTEAAQAFATLAQRIESRNSRFIPASPYRLPLKRAVLDRVRQTLDEYRKRGQYSLSTHELSSVFELLELQYAPSEVATTPEEAVALAQRFGCPIALKVWAQGLHQRTPIGGVELNLYQPEAIVEAWAKILDNLETLSPMTPFKGMTVQPMVPHSPLRALRVGVTLDHVLGPLIELGASDRQMDNNTPKAVGIPPMSEASTQALLNQPGLKAYSRYRRDLPEMNRDELAKILKRLSVLASLIPAINRFKINPLVFTSTGPIVLDAMLELNDRSLTPESGYPHMSICPPDWEDQTEHHPPKGETLTLRPLLNADYLPFVSFIESLSDKSRYLRFHTNAPMSHDRLCELTQPDYARESPWALFAGNTLVASGRIKATETPGTAEFGIVVADAWQRQGLARVLMTKLEEKARNMGFTSLVGYVLRGNEGMQKLMQRLGYQKLEDPEQRDTDPWVKTL